jgi:hypothetical protein
MELLNTSRGLLSTLKTKLKHARLIALSLALAAISTYATAQNTYYEPNGVSISYSNVINGYSVYVLWKPMVVSNNRTIGPAILEFYKVDEPYSFFLTNNHFGIENSKLPFTYSEDGLDIVSINEYEIYLGYDKDDLKSEYSFGTTNQPFFFQDLDFDKIDELVLVESENGQRGVASFKAYKFDGPELLPDRYGITSIEPFRSLDEMSKIDYLTKRITIYKSGGNCANSYEIYKLQLAKNEYEANSFTLETSIEEQIDEKLNKCYELTYSVIGRSKKLLSKKEVNE